MKNKLIVLSGGMDSTTLLHMQKEHIKLAIIFDYGQKHAKKEIACAVYHCLMLGIIHYIIDLKETTKYLKSNLLQDGGDIPEGHYEDVSMKKTVVPFRNGIMLSIGAGMAESENCDSILIANHAGDHTIYPDCRASFIDSMNNAIGYGTYNSIRVEAPFTSLTKKDIALIGNGLNIDYGKNTWSCYKGGLIHCGKCGTCVERKEALNGFDTTLYED